MNKAPDPNAELEYLELREILKSFGDLNDDEADQWILEAMKDFSICNTDVQGDPLLRASAETKARAIKKIFGYS